MILKTIRTAALAVLLAAPAMAQEVPLNTLNGAGGTTHVDGQGGLMAGSLGVGGIVAAIAIIVIAVAASDDGTSSTSP